MASRHLMFGREKLCSYFSNPRLASGPGGKFFFCHVCIQVDKQHGAFSSRFNIPLPRPSVVPRRRAQVSRTPREEEVRPWGSVGITDARLLGTGGMGARRLHLRLRAALLFRRLL